MAGIGWVLDVCIWYGFVECFMAVLGEYWMCVLGKVSLSILWRVLGEYYMCVFCKGCCRRR